MNGGVASGKVIPFSGTARAPLGKPVIGERMMELVRALRRLWRRCQLAGRDDFDRACLLIAGDDRASAERYAAAFFQGVQIFARCRLRFFNAKSDAVSDDEMWLARILVSLDTKDYTSARYLMALRIAPEGHRRLMFLAEGLADRLCGAAGKAQDRPFST